MTPELSMHTVRHHASQVLFSSIALGVFSNTLACDDAICPSGTMEVDGHCLTNNAQLASGTDSAAPPTANGGMDASSNTPTSPSGSGAGGMTSTAPMVGMSASGVGSPPVATSGSGGSPGTSPSGTAGVSAVAAGSMATLPPAAGATGMSGSGGMSQPVCMLDCCSDKDCSEGAKCTNGNCECPS